MRRHDWPQALADYIAAREHAPFRWGKREQDCASFAFAWALVATGIDAMADVPEYASADEADLLLAEIGFERVLDAHFTRRHSIGLAQRGDLALAGMTNGDTALMIVEGDTLVGPGRRKLQRVPRSTMTAAWAV